MTRPLYQSVAEGRLPGKTADFHRGLWFDRFMDVFGGEEPTAEQKRQWIATVAGPESDPRKTGDRDELNRHAQAQLELVKAVKGYWGTFKVDWHFVSGLGLPHPVENGFSWHHTLGVPYLCGASVKGLVRAWMEYWNETDNETLLHWFGSDPSEDESELPEQELQTGSFIFFDALPLEPPGLIVDIMTPHMGKWYENGGEIPMDAEVIPGDWHSPTPIPFLAVKDMRLRFCIAPRALGVGMDETKKVMESLCDALAFLGAGAKTAVGYGVMSADSSSRSECEAYWDDVNTDDPPSGVGISDKERKYQKLAQLCPRAENLENYLYAQLFHAGGELKDADNDLRVYVAGKLKSLKERNGRWVDPDEIMVSKKRKKKQKVCNEIQKIINSTG